jgi:DNA-binding transcriptional MerR regulator
MKHNGDSNDALELFEPRPDAVYPIETAACVAHVSRWTILVCYKHGLVSPVIDRDSGGFYFDEKDIRALQLVEYLRSVCGVNLAGAKMILELSNEVKQLRQELNRLKRQLANQKL